MTHENKLFLIPSPFLEFDRMSVRRLLFGFIKNRFGLVTRKRTTETLGDKRYILINNSFKNSDYDGAWVLALAQRSKVIFDIGSNMGQAALLMMHAGAEEIYLVDPNPEALSIAAESMILNNLVHKARFVCAFASDSENQSVDFYTVGAGQAGSMYPQHAETASKRKSHYSVPTTTVDSISSLFNAAPDFIKIDVEGAEGFVLGGMSEISLRNKPRILVEMHSNADLPMGTNVSKLLSWCEKYRYEAWYMKHESKITSIEQVAHRGRFHALLLPLAHPYPEYLKGVKQSTPIRQAQ